MINEHFFHLLDKYANGTCTEAEKFLVEDWYANFNEDAGREEIPEALLLDVQKRLKSKLGLNGPAKLFQLNHRYVAVASVMLLLLSISAILYFLPGGTAQRNVKQIKIVPGKDQAILKLADGKYIALDSSERKILQTNNTAIGEVKNGTIALSNNPEQTKQTKAELTKHNLLEVPRGGKWKIVLADGTHVWLNAATKLRFPSTFSGGNREVFLDGEAYFEVAKYPEHPFIVHTGKQHVEVLGTHFNINSYIDERATQTTLLEGSAKINGTTILKPGQTGTSSSKGILVEQTDTEAAVAWKEGTFVFDKAPLASIMRQISRWYNVDIHYESAALAKITFSGTAPRSASITTILKRLSLTREVSFSTEGDKITVRPYKNQTT